MAQIKIFSWTNPSSAVARNLDVGFTVAKVTTIDVTNGGSWQWISGMGDGYYQTVASGAITTSNGFTAVSEGGIFAADITGFTNATPGVISATASQLTALGFAAGDTVRVASLADDGTGTSLNGASWTIASISGTSVTLDQDTSSGYSAYVSGGYLSRVTDSDSTPIATENVAIRGITVGTGVVGGNSAAMVAIVEGVENVD